MTSARALAPADPAWPQLEKELLANPEITVLPIVPAAGRESLHRLQVTTRSRMGALALHTGGLLVDHGWLRVLGGRFEVNGPEPATVGRPGRPGEVCYFGPDTLTWESLDAGHSDWLSWIAADGTTEFYRSLRWPGWRTETHGLPLTHGITVYPFLWSQEAHHDLSATTRSPAPISELFSLQNEFGARFAAEPDTSALHIRTD